MGEAPEWIWAVYSEDVSAQTDEVYAQTEPEGFVDAPTKYIRADTHESLERYYKERLGYVIQSNGKLAAALQNIVNGIETGLITSDADETLANALRQARSALSPPSEPQGGRVMTLAERLEKIKGRVLDDATCDLVLIDDAVKEAEIVLLCHGTLRAGQASAHVHDFICNAPTEAATEFLEHHGVDPNGPHTGYLPLSVNPKGGE